MFSNNLFANTRARICYVDDITVDEKDFAEASLVAVYAERTCTMETYPVLNDEEASKLNQ